MLVTKILPVLSSGVHADNVGCDVTVSCPKLASGLPLTPNPRNQNSNLGLYKKVAESLRTDPIFCHMNKGITLLVGKFTANNDGTVTIIYDNENQRHGIVDGGNTYQVIMNEQQRVLVEGGKMLQNSVKISIININALGNMLKSKDLDALTAAHTSAVKIAEATNTTIQVREDSVADLNGRYAWLRLATNGTPIEGKISYRQNTPGYKVRDLLAMLTTLVRDDANVSAKISYTNKRTSFHYYLANQQKYEGFSDILADLLKLSDDINVVMGAAIQADSGKKLINVTYNGYRKRAKGYYTLPLTGARVQYTMHRGYFFPLWGALSELITTKRGGKKAWRLGTVENTLAVFEKSAKKILSIYNKANDVADKIGKDSSIWESIRKVIVEQVIAIEEKASAKMARKAA